MRKITPRWSPVLLLALAALLPRSASAADYELGADSRVQQGVPQGKVEKRVWEDSRIYPGTSSEYWVYVPAQYSSDQPACVMVFQDGQAYLSKQGSVRAPVVFDNLIHRKEMPVTIGVFIDPGKKQFAYDQREVQYVTLGDSYARFLIEEILPEVAKDYNLVDDASGRAICGMSDGGLCSFTVGWERPDAFSKVISHIGSFVRLRRGSDYPLLIRETRHSRKPIRVFLQDGLSDMNSNLGSWTLANIHMESALKFARYDYKFELGTGGHDLNHGGAIFPETMRWIWRDYPGVRYQPADADAVIGTWDVVTNFLGRESRSALTVGLHDGKLTASLNDESLGEVEVTAITFTDGILSYEYASKSIMSKSDTSKKSTMTVWANVSGDTFDGAVSDATKADFELDFAVKGTKRD